MVFWRMCIRTHYVHFAFQPTPLFRTIQVFERLHTRTTELVSLCQYCVRMDRAAALIRQLSGFTTWIKEVAAECEAVHYMIQRNAA